MVVQKTINNLKEKPHDEKKAVASGIAIMVAAILLIGWGFLFMRKIQRGAVPTLQNNALPMDQFDYSLIRETEQQVTEFYRNTTPYDSFRESAVQNQLRNEVSPNAETVNVGGEVDVFGPDFE